MTHRVLTFSQALLALTLLSGCSWLGDVSSDMRVDTGLDPANIDSNVRFRTTYYFRVLTGCKIESTASDNNYTSPPFKKRISGVFVPLNDSLYRFRMTGQAAALFNRVHFESGILRKEQIDPFGSSVRYNEQTHTFTPVSADEVRADNARHTAMQDVEQFRKLYTDLAADEKLTADHKSQLFTKLITMIEDRLDQIKASRPLGSVGTTPNAGSSMARKSPTDSALTKLEQKLIALEEELGKARTHFNNTQKTLIAAKKKVAEIKTNLNDAKAALASKDPITDEEKQKILTLTAELTPAEQALTTAEINRDAAEELITELTKQSADVKTALENTHQNLTTAKQEITTSLTTLKGKIEDLLKELGVATTMPPANQDTAACSGKPSENKYYLLGPEGAKELDPNDRLLLALSVDSKPLISALQQLSDRKFQSAGANYQTMEDLLHERGQILDSRSLLQKAEKVIIPDTAATDQPKLKTLLDDLRKPYAATHTTTPTK